MVFNLDYLFQKLFDELCESVTLPSILYIFHFISTNKIFMLLYHFLKIKCTIFFDFTKNVCNIFLMDWPWPFYQDLILFFLFLVTHFDIVFIYCLVLNVSRVSLYLCGLPFTLNKLHFQSHWFEVLASLTIAMWLDSL